MILSCIQHSIRSHLNVPSHFISSDSLSSSEIIILLSFASIIPLLSRLCMPMCVCDQCHKCDSVSRLFIQGWAPWVMRFEDSELKQILQNLPALLSMCFAPGTVHKFHLLTILVSLYPVKASHADFV